MSQETSIDNLPRNISDDDSKLVDSILNDLNNTGTSYQPQQQAPQQAPQVPQVPHVSNHNPQGGPSPSEQLTPEQMKMIQMQKQMAIQQQQQELMQQQQLSHQKNMNVIHSEKDNSIIDGIKKEAKSIILIIILSILFNIEPIDNIFKIYPSLFVSETGTINMQGVLIKALFIGTFFYIIKSQFF